MKGLVDTHSHILPGVDDGSRSYEESIDIARCAVAAGISKIVATPHMWDPASFLSREEMDEKVAGLNLVFERAGIDLTVYPGAEMYVSRALPIIIEEGLLPVRLGGESDYALVEFPFHEIPAFAEEVTADLLSLGVTPLLAHMERNNEVQADPRIAEAFVEAGCLIQMDAASLTGDLGRRSKLAAEALLEKDVVFCIASDVHFLDARIRKFADGVRRASKLVGEEKTRKLFKDNPASLLPKARQEGST